MNPELPDEKAIGSPDVPRSEPGARTTPPTPPASAKKRPVSVHSLPQGTRLHEFELTDHIGEGGFSIVYRAWDHSLERVVALKEYMPGSLATRDEDTRVHVRNESMQATFDAGLRSFVNESKLLASFDHPSLVKVYRFWEANGTAYMVMPFYEGFTLKDTVRMLPGRPDQDWIMEVLTPLSEALTYIHQRHCFHRDIAPDNILMLADGGRPLLLDFGAARRVITDLSQALTVIVKAGYAPIEQYAAMPDMAQGPWTDVHALAAVVYWMVTGDKPPPAISRVLKESYVPLAEQKPAGYSLDFLHAVDRGLALRPEDRTRSIEAFAEELGIRFTPSTVRTSFRPRIVGSAPTQAATSGSVDASMQVAPTTAHPVTEAEPRPGTRSLEETPAADDDVTLVNPTGGYLHAPAPSPATALAPGRTPMSALMQGSHSSASAQTRTSEPEADPVDVEARVQSSPPKPAAESAASPVPSPVDAIVHPSRARSAMPWAIAGLVAAAASATIGGWLWWHPSPPIASLTPERASEATGATDIRPATNVRAPVPAPVPMTAASVEMPQVVAPPPAAMTAIPSPSDEALSRPNGERAPHAAARERPPVAPSARASVAASQNALECARIVQRLSLGESSPDLLERFNALHCR